MTKAGASVRLAILAEMSFWLEAFAAQHTWLSGHLCHVWVQCSMVIATGCANRQLLGLVTVLKNNVIQLFLYSIRYGDRGLLTVL